MKRLKSIALAIDSLNERVGRVTAWAALLMVLVQFVVVILRYVFAWGSIPVQESIWYFHGVLFMLAAGYTLLKDGHVRVDIFYRESTPRRKALIDLFGVIVFLLPVCLLIWGMSWNYVLNSWRVLEGSTETSGLPIIFLLKTVIPIFVILLALEGISLAIKSFLVVIGIEEKLPVGQHLEEV